MKRKHKCVATKKAYSTIPQCLSAIRFVYKTHKKKRLRYYECPVCLDFHLTHRGTKEELLTAEKEWRQMQSTKHKVHVENQVKKASRKIIQKQVIEFNRLFRKYCENNGLVTEKKKTILVGVLPRAERLRVLAEMKAKNAAIDQRFNLWKSLKALFSVDILIGKRGR